MILALDTSSPVCSVALLQQDKVIYWNESEGQQVHIEALTPFMAEALKAVDDCQNNLKAVALAIGPGSFNGLRIGLSTAKAFAWANKLPIIPIPTIDALAYQLQGKIIGDAYGVIYSHRNFVHYGEYRFLETGSVIAGKSNYGTFDDLKATLGSAFFGDPRGKFGEWLIEFQKSMGGSIHFTEVKASAKAVGQLARKRWDTRYDTFDKLEPAYNVHYEAKKWKIPTF